ncbi:YifB family Mg chelatase-like AAA ATPase [Xenorhabdus nematophila]|uniref:Enzyme (N-terminal) transcriptional regulator with P-loop containing NTP hydrolase domain (C-terminal) n=1 Tax=Xenorhabdus nematophila (strain ATCC 19061 / DSM 3370 / CCUG 14189 / LMG 1036 / NCIMB 9965 / AN6) TaxID=406817 RepID=D3VHV4_XENNA|nr:YifB family Mg chelatase-like AAA ATPase [Xenorhabdus nematophila]CEE90116.1 putative enzyme (N-terminal); transcriptional regulator with P-loop containing NTP hydrolase domain (C-terminal) [Xenorhabdus nematophila str. Anatoliense]CEF31660.1 putative enzyme (N-terminal); transcriptional regulator with P-loop containing NTP hydrolase domain (C-terminal) [Xenorhabdus nematophila str. Websteri]AYA41422.1 ATP-dependent protease [Xenorhabdus nematophila]MBA0020161.1 YifB family Mg chelatase-like
MALSVIRTRATIGIDSPLVTIEAHISNGLPGLTLVGLPETTVKEARDRVRSALLNSGFTYPPKRITVNLAPADLPKEGGRYDLPIAIAVLAASKQISTDKLQNYEFLGELALSGEIRRVMGAIPAALSAKGAGRQLILSSENSVELAILPSDEALMAEHLLQVCHFLEGKNTSLSPPLPIKLQTEPSILDMQDIIGQEQAKRALEITAAGGHNLLLLGPPGTGKTMLASRLCSLLPPLTHQEALEVASINSLVGYSMNPQKWHTRPFRAPHHSSSMAALVGGGSIPRPGEISLAHNGVLFLDELPEFNRSVLDALREPLESGEIVISRAKAKVCFPAQVQLIAAMNPSPTGYHQGLHNRSSPQQVLRYLSKLSGPFLDRFDLSIEVPLLPPGILSQSSAKHGESSHDVKKRVQTARKIQIERCGCINAVLNSKQTEDICQLKIEDAVFLENTLLKLGLSIRAWHRILKVSRTIADLKEQKRIEKPDIMEALSYRSMDRLLIQLQKQAG